MGNTPNIRFKGFTDDWEQRKVSELFRVTRGYVLAATQTETTKTDEKPYPVYSSQTKDKGLMGYYKDYLYEDAITWTTDGANAGTVNYRAGKFYCTNVCGVLLSNEAKANQMIAEALNNVAKGYVSYVGNPKLMNNVMADIVIQIPTQAEEREQLSSLFASLDNLITLHQRKCDETKKLKKFMLQNMFPKKDAKKPEIRFAGFTDDWEQRKFGDLADYKKGPFGSAITKDMFVPKTDEAVKVYEQQNAINKDWSLERYFLPKSYVLSKLKSFEVYGGDIIVSCAGTIGEIYEIPENADPGVINQALMRVRVNEDIVDKKMFIISFSNMIDEFTRTHSNGSAIKNIPPFADLKPMEVLMPSMIEQRKISDYFSNLDHLITLHQRKCDELKEFKKYMLQNMFPQKG